MYVYINKQPAICMQYAQTGKRKNVLNGTPREDTCSDRCPPRLHNRVNSEIINPIQMMMSKLDNIKVTGNCKFV